MITADFDTLLRQASMTAEDYMRSAKRSIDETFGDGYAAKNPALVAAFMQTAATDFATSSNGKVFGDRLSDLARALETLAASLPGATE